MNNEIRLLTISGKFIGGCLKLYEKNCPLGGLNFVSHTTIKVTNIKRLHKSNRADRFWLNYGRWSIFKWNKDDILVSRYALSDSTWHMEDETQPTKILYVARVIESMRKINILNVWHILAFRNDILLDMFYWEERYILNSRHICAFLRAR